MIFFGKARKDFLFMEKDASADIAGDADVEGAVVVRHDIDVEYFFGHGLGRE